MARVNLDGKVWKDPRVKRLAKRRAWSVRETIGTLAAVWDVAYDNKTPIMRRIDVDTAAESEGFADEMVAEDLAEAVVGDLISVRLRGVRERIQYLLEQAERGRLGGKARAANGERTDDGRLASGKPTLGNGQADAKPPPDLPLALSLDLPPAPSPDPDPDPAHGSEARETRKQRGSRFVPTEWHPKAGSAVLPPAQLEYELGQFRNHEFAKPKTDWDRAWAGWQGRAENGWGSTPKNNPTATALEGLREAEEAERIGARQSDPFEIEPDF